jgi:hypothetical protein
MAEKLFAISIPQHSTHFSAKERWRVVTGEYCHKYLTLKMFQLPCSSILKIE